MAARKKSAAKKTASKKSARKTASKKKATGKRTATRAPADAIALLRADHKAVQDLFDKFEKTRSEERKGAIAEKICRELTVHAQIEEEIFYPAAREVLRQEDLLDEAAVEHQSAKDLIAQIESGNPGDDLFDAKVKVLGEYIKHHVKEEQNEMFPQVKKTKLDLRALGEQLQARKAELMQGGKSPARGGSSSGGRSNRSESSSEASRSGAEGEGLVARMARGIGLG